MVLILRLLDRTSNKYYSNTVSLKSISSVPAPVAGFLASIAILAGVVKIFTPPQPSPY